MKTRPTAYLASDCGFSGDKRTFYYGTFVPLVRTAGFDLLDPWEMAPQEEILRIQRMQSGVRQVHAWRRFNRLVGHTNAEAILKSDALIAVLNGSDVDSGTASEIGFAAAHGRAIFGYRDDFRLSGDNAGSLINLQVEYFVTLNGGRIHKNLGSLRRALQSFVRNR